MKDKPDLYSTYDVLKDVEASRFELPASPPSVLFRARQLLLDVCTNEKGEWRGGNPFFDLETILAVLRDDKEHAENFLEPPERARTIKRTLQLEDVFTAIRDQLQARFRGEGRE
jgi:hypothetical protein